MIKRTTLLPILVAATLMLGVPPILLVLATFSAPGPAPADEPAAERSPIQPIKDMISKQSNFALLYQAWADQYTARGGDRNAAVSLGWAKGMSSEWSTAKGRVRLDLVGGSVAAAVRGLGDLEADLWLVANRPDTAIDPQPGDRMLRIGRLQQEGGYARLERRLGPAAFAGFTPDLVVVTRAGHNPMQSRVLVGARSYFEHVYTQARLATEQRQAANRPSWRNLLRPAALASLFLPRAADANSTQILIAHGLVSQDVGDGADLFFRGTFSGNGRTCATCHRAENNLVIDTEFIATLPSTDKLFVASQPGGVPGLERPQLLQQFALILENVDGFENPTVKFVMRGVPHTESLATSIAKPGDNRAPVERTGWGGDGAPETGALLFFAQGAVVQHFTKSLLRQENIDFVKPTLTQLQKFNAYMLATGRLNELTLSQVSLTNTGANNGRILFLDNNVAKCNRCHLNAGANIIIPPDTTPKNRNFNTGVETVVNPARAVENFPFDGGFGAAVNPNRDCDGDLVLDCFGDGTFNTPPLIESADTDTFFHNNTSATIEDAVAFYVSSNFTNSPSGQAIGPIILNQTQINEIGAFLRVINASFNIDIAVQRNTAAITLENNSGGGGPGVPRCSEVGAECGTDGVRETVNAELSLANAEALDAIEVLTARSLHPDAVTLLQSAIAKNNSAINEFASNKRKQLMQQAKNDLQAAKAKFGTGLNLT
ncbi:MAG: hypothetical protein ACRD2T_12210, partial [Thermoanaerobaculia bacterium]